MVIVNVYITANVMVIAMTKVTLVIMSWRGEKYTEIKVGMKEELAIKICKVIWAAQKVDKSLFKEDKLLSWCES